MEFWVDWELWEKMCSVLGCLIVIVLIYGFIVLFYNRRMLKKYAAVEAQERKDGKNIGEKERGEDNIPFGARAIERGVQVDGIWISNQNTPSNSPIRPGTPMGSRRASSISKISSQETLQPPPIMVTACDGNSSPSADGHGPYLGTQSFQPHSSANGVPVGYFEVDRLSPDGDNPKRSETMELDWSKHEYATYQGYLQPGRCTFPTDPVVTLDDGINITTISLDSLAGSDCDFKSQKHSDSSERLIQSPSRPAPAQRVDSRSSHENLKLNPAEDPQWDGGGQGDLDPLRTHRLSHVAETGQLGSTRNSQPGWGGYEQSVHPQELAAKLAKVKEEGDG